MASQDLKFKLLNAVKAREPLWNKKHTLHKNRNVSVKLWKEISKACGMPSPKVSSIWKYMRAEFKRQLIKAYSVDPGYLHTSWIYFNSMLFLKDQIMISPNNSSADIREDTMKDSENMEQEQEVVEDSNYESSCASEDVSQQASSSSLGFKRPLTAFTIPVGEDHRSEAKNKNDVDQNNNDEDTSFFKSMLPHVQKLDARKKMIFRMQTQSLLYNLSFADHINSNNPPAYIPAEAEMMNASFTQAQTDIHHNWAADVK